jgi:hypothetical protein
MPQYKYAYFPNVSCAVLHTYIMALVNLIIFKFNQCLIQQHTMKMYEEVEVQLHALTTSTLCGSERFALCSRRFTFVESFPSTHWTKGWSVMLDPSGCCAEEKNICPCRQSNPVSRVVNPVA